jgi:hypothetical protein
MLENTGWAGRSQMISAELIRRYPFFDRLTHDQILTLARVGEELTVEAGHYFFYERERLKNLIFY